MNPVRGEQKLTVGQVEYLLTPTHEALARIEGRLDLGLLDLAQRFLKNKPRHTDVAVVLQECSRAGGKELPYAQAFAFALEDMAQATVTAAELVMGRFGKAEGSEGKPPATAS